MRDRWATFDCYGTLVDWDRGIHTELGRLFGEADAGRLLKRYHALEPRVQQESPSLPYRDVMARVLALLASDEGLPLAADAPDALGRSLPRWPVFGDVRPALSDLRERGFRLAILSNTDRDLIEASIERIGVRFELAIVASEIGSYKPARRHWEAFYERTGADPSLHVHVGASTYHDIAPARALGIPAIWVNRLGERAAAGASAELSDLSDVGDAAEHLLAGQV